MARPSQPIPYPNGLWSLWAMLENWGYNYLIIGTALAYIETDLERQRRAENGAIAGHGTATIGPTHPTAKFLMAKLEEIKGKIGDQDLELIDTKIEILKAKFITNQRQRPHALPIYTNDVIDAVRGIKDDLTIILSKKFFYYLKPGMAEFYGKPELFGAVVAKKFPAAINDIEWAGNCLALGQSTACVLHLSRAMEIALRRIAGKLKGVTVGPKDAMGDVLRNMAQPIKDLPAQTNAQKRKKERWAECVLNLSHVKTAWRDPGSHGRQSYDEKQARDILERVRGFMQQLATLL